MLAIIDPPSDGRRRLMPSMSGAASPLTRSLDVCRLRIMGASRNVNASHAFVGSEHSKVRFVERALVGSFP